MSDRTDQKLQHTVVGQYTYRHEAEFAAGFLDDADIPYRLQIDDPAMGLTVSAPATLWVRGIDARRAREVLDIPVEAGVRVAPVEPRRVTTTGGAQPGAVLLLRERLLAVVFATAVLFAGSVFWSDAPSPIPMRVVGLVAAGLVVGAAVGRAPRFVKNLLGALSGNAP